MQFEFKALTQKYFHIWKYFYQPLFISREYDKVVSIPDVVLSFQCMLHELIELVHIDIHKKLTRKIAERDTLTLTGT